MAFQMLDFCRFIWRVQWSEHELQMRGILLEKIWPIWPIKYKSSKNYFVFSSGSCPAYWTRRIANLMYHVRLALNCNVAVCLQNGIHSHKKTNDKACHQTSKCLHLSSICFARNLAPSGHPQPRPCDHHRHAGCLNLHDKLAHQRHL